MRKQAKTFDGLAKELQGMIERLKQLEEENRNLRIAMEIEGDEAKKKLVKEHDELRQTNIAQQQQIANLYSQIASLVQELQALRGQKSNPPPWNPNTYPWGPYIIPSTGDGTWIQSPFITTTEITVGGSTGAGGSSACGSNTSLAAYKT
jgi:uncharacterized coiled-coil protein SlyX